MNTFPKFPKNTTCKICGTNENKECILISVDGTNKGSICEAIPVHTDCLRKSEFRYIRELNIFYTMGKEEEEK